ncbi:hypothetical protein GCM10010274_66530 [Streptomyces lavendofoliae]|uniref:Uncharacterized protein n=1 Tax=Streptomyces lavendofoliae TaxID=67314 RepID=A0A918M8N4_9ACTN|nr:hypothetical protein GCM10010274_66530 [Streptomyces lavendofoliae]
MFATNVMDLVLIGKHPQAGAALAVAGAVPVAAAKTTVTTNGLIRFFMPRPSHRVAVKQRFPVAQCLVLGSHDA